MSYTILISYRATCQWLVLSRDQRNHLFENSVIPILERFKENLTVRFYDSEGFHAKTSDFLIVTCDELAHYYFFMECLRDTLFFSVPYIELQDVIIGIENGFRQFEQRAK